MSFNSEELKLIEAERKEILNDILIELQTKSLKELFLETSDKEKEMKEVEDILEKLYELLDLIEYNVKHNIGKKDRTIETQETLESIYEIENDYSNYIQGGEGFISEYLNVWYE